MCVSSSVYVSLYFTLRSIAHKRPAVAIVCLPCVLLVVVFPARSYFARSLVCTFAAAAAAAFGLHFSLEECAPTFQPLLEISASTNRKPHLSSQAEAAAATWPTSCHSCGSMSAHMCESFSLSSQLQSARDADTECKIPTPFAAKGQRGRQANLIRKVASVRLPTVCQSHKPAHTQVSISDRASTHSHSHMQLMAQELKIGANLIICAHFRLLCSSSRTNETQFTSVREREQLMIDLVQGESQLWRQIKCSERQQSLQRER